MRARSGWRGRREASWSGYVAWLMMAPMLMAAASCANETPSERASAPTRSAQPIQGEAPRPSAELELPRSMWGPWSRHLLLYASDGRTHVIETRTWTTRAVVALGDVVAFDPSGTRIATWTRQAGYRLWDLDGELQLSLEPSGQSAGHPLVFSGDGQRIVSAAGTVWDTRRGAIVSEVPFTGAVFDFVPSHDGRRIVVTGRSVHVYDADRGDVLSEAYLGQAAADVSPGGAWVASAEQFHTVHVWPTGRRGVGVAANGVPMPDAPRWEAAHRYTGARALFPDVSCENHTEPRFLDDGETLVVVGGGGYWAYDIETWQVLGMLLHPPGWEVVHANRAFSPVVVRDGDRLFTWDTRHNRAGIALSLEGRRVNAMSPDGRIVEMLSDDHIDFVSTRTGETVWSWALR